MALIFGKKAGIDLPRTEGEYKQAFVTIFSGTNPSDLGEEHLQEVEIVTKIEHYE